MCTIEAEVVTRLNKPAFTRLSFIKKIMSITEHQTMNKHTADYKQTGRRMASSEMLRRVALVRTDVSEEHIASIIRVK
jgi:hypothetical protein